jgi:hypothetical protein
MKYSKPIIHIKNNDYVKIMAYAEEAYKMYSTEIGGMAVCLKDRETGEYLIKDPKIMKQTVSGANCDLDKDALAKYLGEESIKYKDYIPNNLIYVWWHSHHTMGAFWSGTDMKTIEDAQENGNALSLVVSFNKKKPHVLTLSIKEPMKAHMDCELNIIQDTSFDRNNLIKEIKECCKETKSIFPLSKPINGDTATDISQSDLFEKTSFKSGPLNLFDFEDYDKIYDETERILDDKAGYKYLDAIEEMTSWLDQLKEEGDMRNFRAGLQSVNEKYEEYEIKFKTSLTKAQLIEAESADALLTSNTAKLYKDAVLSL